MSPRASSPGASAEPVWSESARFLAASALDAPAIPLTTATRKLTSRALWFEGGGAVAAVTGHRPSVLADVDLALAYGLFHAKGRRLVLVVPSGSERSLLARCPWLRPEPEVWTFDLASVAGEPGVRPARSVLDAPDGVLSRYLNEWGYTAEAESPASDYWRTFLGASAPWLEPLLDWAGEDPDLAPAHRANYLAWHCCGTKVLSVSKSKNGSLRVTAGVHRSADPPRPVELQGPIGRADIHRLIGAAATGAATLLDGDDGGRREHRLQAVMASMKPRPLGLTDYLRREYPAWRPYPNPRGRSFIDFLGGGEDGNLHVVETKIGDDPMLVIQGLDYWVWAMANRTRLARRFDLGDHPRVVIDFVGARPSAAKPPFGPYTSAQAASLAPEVEFAFHEITRWKDSDKVLLAPLVPPP